MGGGGGGTGEAAAAGPQVRLVLSWKGEHRDLLLNASSPMRALFEQIEAEYGVNIDTQKLFVRSKGITAAQHAGLTVAEAGLLDKDRVMLVGSRAEEVEWVRGLKEEWGTRGFNDELRLLQARRSRPTGPAGPPSGEYTFQDYRVLQPPGLTPPSSDALNLLHRLASDPGIVGVMEKHKYKVGVLTEMPPEGKVGVSPVCLLGFNKNRGQEISLRLRTDDLRGFRKYLRIRETLIHELAHMVWDEHDDRFKALNSQHAKEVEAISGQQGSFLLGGEVAEVGQDLEWAPNPDDPRDLMLVAARAGGRLDGGGARPAAPAAYNAAEAAILRAAAAGAKAQGMAAAGAAAPSPAAATTPPPPAAEQAMPVQDEGASAAGGSGMEVDKDGEGGLEEARDEAMDEDPAPAQAQAPAPTGAGAPLPSAPATSPCPVCGDEVSGGDRGMSRHVDAHFASPSAFAASAAPAADPAPPPSAPATSPCPVCGDEVSGGDRGMSRHVDAHFASPAPPAAPPPAPAPDPEPAAAPPPAPAAAPEDDAVAALSGAAAEAGARAAAAVAELVAAAGPAAGGALKALHTVVDNALKHPGESKYRQLRYANAAFHGRVGRYKGGLDVLAAAGFREEAEEGGGGGGGGGGRVMRLRRDDPGLLWLVLGAIQEAQGLRAGQSVSGA